MYELWMERDVVYVARRQHFSMIYERWIVSWAGGWLSGWSTLRAWDSSCNHAFLFVGGTVFGKHNSSLFLRFLIVFFLWVFSFGFTSPLSIIQLNASMNEFRLSLDSSPFQLNALLSHLHLITHSFIEDVFFCYLDFNHSFNSEPGNLLFMFVRLIAVSVVETDS